ncbi:MAG: aminoglycoside phosphotransferase family protein [Prevotellaceae bacterium]|nr:aminoglycoside phosphotransferase family protein [Prevotellaceae bacterium]MCD8304087.1 aminoglycoside phosphotransferase family protein [Prevotellaceae bacterium]
MEQSKLEGIVALFATTGTVKDIKPLGEGLINDTYKVTTLEDDAPDYVLQRVNHNVFPDVDMVMRNIKAVTEHIRGKLVAKGETDIERKVLRFIPLRSDPEKLHTIVDGTYWRLMVFVPNAITKQAVNPESSRAAGRAFGNFQAMLADLPIELGETIKDFHNMEFRLQQLHDAIEADAMGRVKEPQTQQILREVEKRAFDMCKAERMGREGILPKRVCHCDTKVNNMMFDYNDNVLCVIDLDTVMPNYIFSDYGDFLRTGANFVEEDFPQMKQVGFNMDIFRAFTEGYLESASSFLLPVEIENLPYAAALFPYMQCVRFLWDYLSGDKYWKSQYPQHNYIRANNQLHLLFSVEEHADEMKAFIAQCMDKIKSKQA